MTPTFDVAVLGPGPAGSTCAGELARAGLTVALFGPLADEPHRSGEVIGHRAQQYAPGIDQLAGLPVRFVASAWSGGVEARDLKLSTGRAATTAVRPAFDRHLLSEARRAGASHIAGRVLGCTRDGAAWQVHTTGCAAPIRARFVVEATGRRGRSIVIAGSGRQYLDRLVVIWCFVAADEPMDDTLHLAACAQGWWYRVPNASGRYFLALVTDADLLPPGDRAGFFRRSSIGTRFEIQVVAQTRFTALRTTDARTAIRLPQSAPGWMPIGDAAYSLDPLSGDGVARAIADGSRIARALIANYHRINANLELREDAAQRLETLLFFQSTRSALYAAGQRDWEAPFWARRTRSGRP